MKSLIEVTKYNSYKSVKVLKTPNIKLPKNEQYLNHSDVWHWIVKIQYISNHLSKKNPENANLVILGITNQNHRFIALCIAGLSGFFYRSFFSLKWHGTKSYIVDLFIALLVRISSSLWCYAMNEPTGKTPSSVL